MTPNEAQYTTLRVEREGAVATVTLARPDVRNAFDEAMIADLTAAFTALGQEAGLRVFLL
jgi:methylglutaconyl-CoA hydratase